MNPIFEIDSLTVAYGSRTAVSGLSLKLEPGTCLGLLGANGAGKTSTVRALLGMCKPKSGNVTVLGMKPGMPRAFRRIGFAPEDGSPPEYLSGREYLRFVSAYRISDRSARKTEIDGLLEWFELDPKKKIREYSKGMRRRITLAQAFLGKPDLLILDEPLNGLDPMVILRLREKLLQYIAAGGSALYSSHILSEVEKTCQVVVILSGGKQLAYAPTETLVREHGSVETAFATLHSKEISP